jgi:hypothetical protein
MSGLSGLQVDFGDIDYPAIIMHAESTDHPALESKDVTRYVFFTGSVELVHDPIVELRIIDPDGAIIPIPI